MVEIDRYAIAMTAAWQRDIERDYERFEFHPAVAKLQTFCSEDLGAFWLDILKDRLYTTAPGSPARRSAQTALYHVAQSIVRLMAPILSFTAEEAWPLLAPAAWKAGGETIFTQTWHAFDGMGDLASEDAQSTALLRLKWEAIRAVRADVLRKLEEARSAGAIGSSLQAEVEVRASGETFDALASLGDDLRFVFITSQARVVRGADDELVSVSVVASEHAKCERCWHYRADVGADPAHPTICGRCNENLHGAGEPRRAA
jgi:isoleucyl-tRNA synthetase